MLLDPGFLIVQTLNGLQLAALLFLLSIGLSVVFGLMNFINLAHGTLFMVGAYLSLSAVRAFARCTFDGPVDSVSGEVLVLCPLYSHAQLEVGVGIGAALFDGDDNFLRQLGE